METNAMIDKQATTRMPEQMDKNTMLNPEDEPLPKRICVNQASEHNNTATEGFQNKPSVNTMPSLDDALPLPIPTAVGTLNIGQQGNISNNYGIGTQQIHVTNGGLDLPHHHGVDLPQMFVQPNFNPMNSGDYGRFQNEVVSNVYGNCVY